MAWMSLRWLEMYFSERIASFWGEFPLSLRVRGLQPMRAEISRFPDLGENSPRRQRRQRENFGTENKIDFPHVYFAPRSKSCSFRTNIRATLGSRREKITLCDANLQYSDKNEMWRGENFSIWLLSLSHYDHDASCDWMHPAWNRTIVFCDWLHATCHHWIWTEHVPALICLCKVQQWNKIDWNQLYFLWYLIHFANKPLRSANRQLRYCLRTSLCNKI